MPERKHGAHIIGALVVGRKIAPQNRRLGRRLDVAAAAQAPDQRHQEQHRADIGRDRISGQTEHMHGAEAAVHHRPARTQSHLPERQREPFGGERPLHEVVVADRGPAGGDQYIGAEIVSAARRARGRSTGPGRCRGR